MIKAIIFDWFNVCTTAGWIDTVAARLSADLSLPEDKVKAVLRELFPSFASGKIGAEEYLRALIGKLNSNLDPAQFAYFFEILPPVNLELLHHICLLKKQYKVYLLSGNFKPVWENYASHLNMGRYFEHTFLSFDYRMTKHDPELWKKVIAEIGLPAEEILVVDDNLKYIKIAQELGCKAVLFTGNKQFGRELKCFC